MIDERAEFGGTAARSALHGWQQVPCGHLAEAPEARCNIARRFPADCPGCSAYIPGLTAQERVRCEVWTRVMGYHRPVSAFNPGKQAEHQERRYFRERPQAVIAPPRAGKPRLQWL